MIPRAAALAAAAGLALTLLPAVAENVAAADTVDEIHYSYGDTATSVVVNWRGTEKVIHYGSTDHYGSVAVASSSAITPVDRPGPFREVVLTGLAPDSTYHYRIGAGGADHVLRTAPLGSFRFVDVGDTASTLCKPWVGQVHTLIAELAPRFVTHGGDISEANVCGVPAVHAYYVDQQVWSTGAAFQPSWGNHEYGYPAAGAPAGTPRDSLANYKGRGRVTNPQTLAIDHAGLGVPPGCGGGSRNTCRGEDWGFFRAGGVQFISYPEIWQGALADWQTVAAVVMQRAQQDPSIDFIVTYGHRPAYSSQTANGWDPSIRAAVDALAARFSPRPDNPTGKYVVNLAHHVHALEVFRPINGLTHITNATGGQGQVSLATPDPNSLFRLRHPGVLAGDYDAAGHRLTLRWVCGPSYPPGPKDPCRYGDTVYTVAFAAGGAGGAGGPGGPPSIRQWVGNPGVETDLAGWAGRYGASPAVSVSRVTSDAHSGRAALRVRGRSGARGLSSGVKDDPPWVAPAAAGATFIASAWVRPSAVRQEIVLRVRELTAAGSVVTDSASRLRADATQWRQLVTPLTARGGDTRLSIAIYAKDLDAGEWFLVDDLSLTGG